MFSTKSIKKFLVCCVVSASFAVSSVSSAAAINDVIEAYKTMLVGRTLLCDEGTKLRFYGGQNTGSGFSVAVEATFSGGRGSSGSELIQAGPTFNTIYVDQIAEGVTTRRNIASIEVPYHVFRIRPMTPQSTDFITRDCVRRSESEGTICYIKVRYMSDVIVSPCKEVKYFRQK